MRHPIHTRSLPLLLLLPTACSSIGPETLRRDRFDYSAALGDSWKYQTLLNIVKLRYMDLPIFLDIGQIVAGYSLETGISLGGTLSSPRAVQGDNVTLGGTARFTDRPTITYTPMTGDRYLRNMLEPIEPSKLFQLVQAGYAADMLFELTVKGINGLQNRSAIVGGTEDADAGFVRAVQLIRELQLSDAVGMRLEPPPKGEARGSSVVFFRGTPTNQELTQRGVELRQLLKLPPAETRFELIYSPVQEQPNQIAMQTRSLLQVLGALSTFVEIPAADLETGRATPAPPMPDGRKPLLRVQCSDDEPADAFFTVRYRDRWFWIDDRDTHSKRTFAFVMFVFTLSESAASESKPVLTIPAQ